MNFVGEALRLFQMRLCRFAPDQVTIRRVRKSSGNGVTQSAPHLVEPLGCALPGEEFVVNRVDVAGDQVRAVSIGARNDKGRNAHDISS